MLQIYHAPMTRSLRVIWLCEELEVPYEVIPVDFSPEYRSTPEWRALNPTGKVPVMIDNGITMFESGAMVQHILNCYGNGRLEPKPRTEAHAHFLQWCWFGESTLARPVGEIVNHKREFPDEQAIPAIVTEMADRVEVSLHAVAGATADSTWLIGEHFTAADVMVGYSLHLANLVTPDRMPATLAPYWQRLQARKGYQKTIAV